MKFLSIAFFSAISLNLLAQEYPPQCQGKLKSIKLCLVDPKFFTKLPGFYDKPGACSDEKYEVYHASNPDEIVDRLKIVSNECKQIEKLRFWGHGKAGHTDAGDISLGDVDYYLSPFAYLFPPNGKITITGCNTGRGCLGRIYMLTMAQALLTKGGEVRAPDFYAVTIPPAGIVKHASLTGKQTLLTYNPQDPKNTEKWNYELEGPMALKLDSNKGMVGYCEKEIHELVKRFEEEKTKAFKRGCEITKIPGMDWAQKAENNLFNLFVVLDPKKRTKVDINKKKELNELFAQALNDFDTIKQMEKDLNECKK